MPSPSPNDLLSRELADWRVTPLRNPHFRAAVWARIHAARHPATWYRFARAHPSFVSALFLGAVLAGAWTGRAEADERADLARNTIAASYVHSLDARWMRGH